jgi:hypothetical protein
MNYIIVVPKHVDIKPSEDGQITETYKGRKYIWTESHWTVLTIIILYFNDFQFKTRSVWEFGYQESRQEWIFSDRPVFPVQ